MNTYDELKNWAMDNSQYGPAPTVILPHDMSEYRERLAAGGGTVVLGDVRYPMIAWDFNPIGHILASERERVAT